MKYSLNWKQPLLSMSKRFFIFITLIFIGFVALSTYKTQLDMELGSWLFYQYLKILLVAFVVLFAMAQASRLFSVELRSEDVVGRNRFFQKVSIPYTEMIGVSMGKLLIVDCMVIRTNSRKKIYAPFDLDGFSDFSNKIDARLMNNKARRSISEA
ncbi:hypothetical protein J4G63_16940 [Aeromonas sobria]|uniref:Uncharacterized protein n=1 Tax=Aeromonas sobria TaxID=646 RepID=A0A1S2CSN5_AERSO|nr:hypothetical protein [Aeromonas sobria]MBS4688923.1 hypothetical protein [Aeromonas sobria]OHY91740.1 hypothetical protein BJD16_15225 [Aeromonas sobria]